ncbi:MAG: phosphatase PAP2 family protein [Candidatus Nanopelagicales bacterium]
MPADVRSLPGRRGAVVCLVLGAVLLGAAALLTVAVLRGATDATDLSLDTAIHEAVRGQWWLLDLCRVLRLTGGPAFLTVLSTVLVILLAVTRRWGWAAYLAATALGGVIISEWLKATVARPRPVWADPYSVADGFSYPSGHALAGITNWVVYGVIVLFLVPGRAGRVVAVVLMVWGVAMAPSRLVLGVHWPADVVGGWLFGFGWVLVVSGVGLLLVNRRAGRSVVPGEPLPTRTVP